MLSIASFKSLALSFKDSSEEPHFHKTSFRLKGKIFATLEEATGIVCILLNPKDQSVYCLIDSKAIYPVPNKWGLKGVPFVQIKNAKKEIVREMLAAAYNKLIC